MTRYLSASTRKALLADLASFGFIFKDENGEPTIPEQWDTVHHNGNDALYLGHVPIQTGTDEEGNPIMGLSTDFCANVTACEGHTFATETFPKQPYNVFA